MFLKDNRRDIFKVMSSITIAKKERKEKKGKERKGKEKENPRRNILLALFLLRNSEADFVVKNKSIGRLRNMGRI